MCVCLHAVCVCLHAVCHVSMLMYHVCVLISCLYSYIIPYNDLFTRGYIACIDVFDAFIGMYEQYTYIRKINS